ncbi:MAG: hypothetical protein H9917_10340 [Candidatus Oceanisphaera merdipullorum]|nr:hypothetical protein [Candidatus Oceanisphaera merdipullorum]
MAGAAFDNAVAAMDEAITKVMASPYVLVLKIGGELAIKAILEHETGESTQPGLGKARAIRATTEQAMLTVLGQRLARDQVLGAQVETALGTRWVSEVFYPDETTTELQLGLAGDAVLPSGNGVRFVS